MIERNGDSAVVKTIESPREQTELILLLGAASLFLFFWGINGFRLTDFSVGGVSGASKFPEVEAAKAYAGTNAEPIDVPIPETTVLAEDSEPNTKASGSVVISDEAEAVYHLDAVPMRVIKDLFLNWPENVTEPRTLSSFEFAARKTGRGNNPWILKFRDAPAMRVAYGGQGKSGATVGQQD